MATTPVFLPGESHGQRAPLSMGMKKVGVRLSDFHFHTEFMILLVTAIIL